MLSVDVIPIIHRLRMAVQRRETRGEAQDGRHQHLHVPAFTAW